MKTADLIEAGYAWDDTKWVPPGQLFGDLPQTQMSNRKRHRQLTETKQELLKLLDQEAPR